ncbi:MAG: ECF-type sigma factor [Dokdonella sp.]
MHDFAGVLPEPASADVADIRRLDGPMYTELTRLARGHLGRSGTLSLDAPSLVHEAYLRFSRQGAIASAQRQAFLAYASRVMRTVIVDYVRERRAQKRGGGERMLTLTTGVAGASLGEDDIEHLDGAMKALQDIDARAHVVVEMRYFGGMTEEEIAALLDVSVPTIKRDWRKARAFLFDAIGKAPS